MATPEQCPRCARFLSKAFVSGLAESDQPCPKCGDTLTASMFGVGAAPLDAPAPRRVPPPDAAEVASVRPPDRAPDVLEGWDTGTPLPPAQAEGDEIVVALPAEAAAVVGIVSAVAGFVVARKRPVVGALLGAVAGIVVAAAGRAIYRRER